MTERLRVALTRRANHRGIVLAREEVLRDELHASGTALRHALAELEAAGAIEVFSPLPFVVLKLLSWSGSSSPRVGEEQQISSERRQAHIEVPVSSFAAAAAIHTEDGGAGEGEALLGDVLKALGPSADRDEFRQMLARYSPSLIRRCLDRVGATKAIRVSRAALFRSLLEKLSR
jgi:hypothetical protein